MVPSGGGLILHGPAIDTDFTLVRELVPSSGSSFLFGDPANQFNGTAIALFPNGPFPPIRPAEIEIMVFYPLDLSPQGCLALSFCNELQSGVTYDVEQIQWEDGTTDDVTFRWTDTPEPVSVVLLGTTTLGLFRRRRRRKSLTIR